MPNIKLKDKVDYLERAARAYADFKERMNHNAVLTADQKRDRLRAFLDAHVSVFDEYYETYEQLEDPHDHSLFTRNLKSSEKLSRDARSMAWDITAFFAGSKTGTFLARHAGRSDEQLGQMMNDRAQELGLGQWDRNFVSGTDYMKMAGDKFASMQKHTSLDFSSGVPQRPERAAPIRLTDAQKKGVRDISAFLYRNTLYGYKLTRTDYTAFLDGLAMRPPEELLLTYYLIQTDSTHGDLDIGLLQGDNPGRLDAGWLTYVPNLAAFKPKMFKGIARGFFNRLSGNSLDWDKLSDAARTAEETMNRINALFAMAPGRPVGRPGPGPSSGPERRGPISSNSDPEHQGPVSSNSEPENPMSGGREDARQDNPELIERLGRVADEGLEALRSEHPSRESVQRFAAAVNELNRYLTSQETSGWSSAKGGAGDFDRYVGYLKTPASQTAQILKGLAQNTTDKDASGKLMGLSTDFSWGGVPLTALSAVISLVTLTVSIRDIFKGGKTGAELAIQVMGGLKDLGTTLNSGYSATRGIAGLANASWITSTAAVGAAGWGGIAVGGISLVHGMSNLTKGQMQTENMDAYKRQFLSREASPEATPAQQEAFAARKEMLGNIAKAGRDSSIRRSTGGGFQAISGGLQALAGATLLLGAPILSAGFALAGFVVGITGSIVNYFQKKSGKLDVVDRYIGMDRLYSRFIADHGGAAQEREIHRRYGSESDIKKMLRKNAEGSLGFSSDNKMHAFIMWRYAQALYNGAFRKADGRYLTKAEYDRMSQAEKEERNFYFALLQGFGFDNYLPRADGAGQPTPSLNAIYKKLME